ncbi:MAG: PAS domain-containing protein [Alphaproteobacteria bacterium]|nr:PAS domain-containing protein [Alphaproteobacteria bacterium]
MNEFQDTGAFRPQRIRSERLRRFHEYWRRKAAGRIAPLRADIDPLEVSFALGHLLIAEAVPPGPRFRFRLMGDTIVERFAIDLTGRFLDDYPEENYRELVARTFSSVIQRGEPVVVDRDFATYGRRYRYEGLCLPLSSDGGAIDMLIACLEFKEG